jgi:predicted MFS family arabinose efflux permease
VLAEPMKRDLQLSDTAVGLINGFGFLVVYAVLGIPIARISDRGRYGVVIATCVALWSAMTLMGGLVRSGWELAATRMGVALGEAGSTPAAHAFISSNFAPDRRSAPLAIYTLHVPIAMASGLTVGGLLGEAIGWRGTFMSLGLAGLLLAPLVLFTLGAHRGLPPGHGQPDASLRSALVLLRKPSFIGILLGTACIGMGGYALNVFTPAFLMRVHGLSLGEVGAQYGPLAGVIGVVTLMLTGWISDRLGARDPRWLLWAVAIMIVLFLPFATMAWFIPSRTLALVFSALSTVISTAYLAPVVAAVQRLAPLHLRATASAILLFCSGLFGGLGPFLCGLISDAWQAELGAQALARALLVAPVAYVFAAVLYVLATRDFIAQMVKE